MYAYNAKSDGVEESEQKFDEDIGERVKLGRQNSAELNEMITENDMIINKEFFKNYFHFQGLSDMQEKLRKTKNAQKDKELVKEIQSGLFDLKNEIEKMSKDEINIEKPDVIVYTVERIIDFNKQLETKDMPDLEREESAEQRRNQKEKRIKNINSTTNA